MSVFERFRSFVTYLRRSTGIRIININGKKTFINAKERHGTIENAHKTLRNAQECSGLLRNGQKRLGTIESERSNAMERIVENGHVHALKTKELLYH
jgi:3,4-dihydroxy-2-butanone 4-phosphate synthase